MADKKGHNKKKRDGKRVVKLRILSGVDLCACGGGHRLRCQGICREKHTNESTGVVNCSEKYRVTLPSNKKNKDKKRTWKYGKQGNKSKSEANDGRGGYR